MFGVRSFTSFEFRNSIEIKNLTFSYDGKRNALLAVTHKLDPDILKRYDEIFVMEDGEIVERSTLDELLEKRGYFYYMYNYGIDEKEAVEEAV
ncbi:ABC-type multidrug transport system fused ATPase/permease subunit [Caldanaerobacter subterraneus subsp. tengcongensis MB4]|uniref:ABC transporter ATP-binding protein n=1 Tax=Caldanaerobacter subterraneus subsp. tengcongensis (strain DSM 15242 / JCM 11007 / NBRC 100824 / MB4) TaxID=273068 RepID=Q8RAN6_CALS4|nr:hypothetical protein TTE1175 [Caldanaerobacter subterraneus subsp. tengcongensis MB4]MCS3916040.1 ABC-type multidrug transport system fused ATPase/permease subunit [Caldanaerobacter subterraneus subsp. tengcongensis MB4]